MGFFIRMNLAAKIIISFLFFKYFLNKNMGVFSWHIFIEFPKKMYFCAFIMNS